MRGPFRKYFMKPADFFPACWIRSFTLVASLALLGTGCQSPRPGTFEPRTGDEIVVAGKFVHTGTPVVLWLDPGGYDAYRVERRFAPFDESGWRASSNAIKDLKSPNRYGMRVDHLSTNEIERVRGGGWDLPLLQKMVDQFVIHFDDASISRNCFKTLHDDRDLSVHFMLDIDGTIYQTLDLKERAWHATTSNTRSVGIEIANTGAFHNETNRQFAKWYKHEPGVQTTITIPQELGNGGVHTPGFVGHPARPDPIWGNVQGQDWVQYDYTPQQYAALVKLTATLCQVFPKLKCHYPADADGHLITHKLPDDMLNNYEGVLGHYHIQTNKEDPGPAFNWDYVIGNAQKIINHGFTPEVEATSGGKIASEMK